MKNISYIVFALIGSIITSCDNSQLFEENYANSSIKTTITKASLEDTTVYYINNEEDFASLLQNISIAREKYMNSKGWKKVETSFAPPLTKASVQEYSVYSHGREQIDNSRFKTKFSASMIDQINNIYNATTTPLSSKKTYICGWDQIIVSIKLEPNQRAGARPSPLCGFIPSKKESYTEGGYESFVNSNNNSFIMVTNSLRILQEDTKNPTTLYDYAWPYSGWGHLSYEYEFRYSVLTL